ncbi:MAG: outer membrane beta-barrel protein [Verrucomicrobia bacterium]|nr:outer membrane beta-barrel protein [Verrucomicrobiota bacterium]
MIDFIRSGFCTLEYTNILQEELNMKFNQWTLALASAGMVSLGSIAVADSHSVLSQVSKTTLSGYVDTSAIWALGSGGNGNFPGRTNDGVGRADGFNLNVVQVSLEKPLDESEWASGYKVDMWMGPDSQWLGNYSSGSFGANDFSLKQAYVALRAPIGNGLDLKMGVFDTVIGYEVANSPANPNFSRSYGFALEPFQHTGLLASYQLTDELSVSAGVANTHPSGINARAEFVGGSESQKTYMGAVTYTIPEDAGFLGGGAVYAGIVEGLAGGPREQSNYYAGVTVPTPVDGLAVGIAFDYVDNIGSAIGAGQIDAYSIAGYGSYQVSEKMTFNARVDYVEGDDGLFFDEGAPGFVGAANSDNELLSVTGTIDYSLWENVISRLEVRWDHSLNSNQFGGPSGTFFGGADDENVVTVGVNAIYQF